MKGKKCPKCGAIDVLTDDEYFHMVCQQCKKASLIECEIIELIDWEKELKLNLIMENKTPIQELIDHFDREVKLGFLSQDSVHRIAWYLENYWIEKEQEYGKQQYAKGEKDGYNQGVKDCIENAKAKAKVTHKSKNNNEFGVVKYYVDEDSMKKLLKP